MDKPTMLVLDPQWQRDHLERLDFLTGGRFDMITCSYFTRECIEHGEIAVMVDIGEMAKNPPHLVICELELPNIRWSDPPDFHWGLRLLENLRRHPLFQMPVIAVCERLPHWLMPPTDRMTRLRLHNHWRLAAFLDWLTGREAKRKQLQRLEVAGVFTWDDLKSPRVQCEFWELEEKVVFGKT